MLTEGKNMLEADSQRRPVMLVFAGPNGSGKTTVTQSLPTFGTYVNADDIKKKFSKENGQSKIYPNNYWPETELRKFLGQ